MLLFGASLIVAASAVGAALGLLGRVLQSWISVNDALPALAAVGVVLALLDFRSHPFAALTFVRQTCPAWYRVLGPRRAFALWGLDLGLGFSTIRTSSLFWIVAGATVALLEPTTAMLVMSTYGVGLYSAVVVAALKSRAVTDLHHPAAQALAQAQMAKRLSIAMMLWLATTFAFMAVVDVS